MRLCPRLHRLRRFDAALDAVSHRVAASQSKSTRRPSRASIHRNRSRTRCFHSHTHNTSHRKGEKNERTRLTESLSSPRARMKMMFCVGSGVFGRVNERRNGYKYVCHLWRMNNSPAGNLTMRTCSMLLRAATLLAAFSCARALKYPASPLLKRFAPAVDPLPPAGFEWAGTQQQRRGPVLPTDFLPKVESAGIPGLELVNKYAPECTAVIANVTASCVQHAAEICESAKIGETVCQIRTAARDYPKMAAAVAFTYWRIMATRVIENGPSACGVFADIGRGVGAASIEYYKVAAAAATTYWGIVSTRVKEHGPEACGVFTDIGRGVGAACVDYYHLATAAMITYYTASTEYFKTLVAFAGPRCRKLSAAAMEAAAECAAKFRTMNLDDVCRRVSVAGSEYYKIIAATAIAYWTIASARVKEHGPEACSVFTDIGRGVGSTSVEYYKVAAAAAITYGNVALARVKEHGPEACSVFTDIGRGVGSACVDYYMAMAAVAGPQVEKVSAQVKESDLYKAAVAVSEAQYKSAVAKAIATIPAIRLYAMKREGQTVVARRMEIAVALAPLLRMIALRREGAAAVARRAEMVQAFHVKTLKREGGRRIAERAANAAALRTKMLKRDGKTVAADRAARATALEEAIDAIVLRREARAAEAKALKLAALKQDGEVAIVRRAEAVAALQAYTLKRQEEQEEAKRQAEEEEKDEEEGVVVAVDVEAAENASTSATADQNEATRTLMGPGNFYS